MLYQPWILDHDRNVPSLWWNTSCSTQGYERPCGRGTQGTCLDHCITSTCSRVEEEISVVVSKTIAVGPTPGLETHASCLYTPELTCSSISWSAPKRNNTTAHHLPAYEDLTSLCRYWGEQLWEDMWVVYTSWTTSHGISKGIMVASAHNKLLLTITNGTRVMQPRNSSTPFLHICSLVSEIVYLLYR